MSEQEASAEELRDVAVAPDGSGPKDRIAPTRGAELREVDWNEMVKDLPEKERAKFAQKMLASQPGVLAAASRTRRERIRLLVTIVVFAAIVGEIVAAICVAAIIKAASWDHVKDWLTISLAPFVAAATLAATFWFPTKETD